LSTADDKPGTLGGFPDPPATSPLGKAQLPQRDDTLPVTFARIAAMPPDAVLAIFQRYGRPLAVEMPPPAADDQRAVLEWPAGAPEEGGATPAASATVRVLKVMGYGDVIPNDYFVLEMTGEEPVAVTGPFFAAALEALARAAGIN
jgi:hypothetical protein